MAARPRRLGQVMVLYFRLKTPSFITGDLGGTTSLIFPFPLLYLWHSFLSELELVEIDS